MRLKLSMKELISQLVNSGALRQDIEAGLVTKGDLISAFPFPNTVVITKLKGSQVKNI